MWIALQIVILNEYFMRVHHAIPTDSVLTDAIPTVHSRDVGWLTAVEKAYGQYRLEDAEPNPEKQGAI